MHRKEKEHLHRRMLVCTGTSDLTAEPALAPRGMDVSVQSYHRVRSRIRESRLVLVV